MTTLSFLQKSVLARLYGWKWREARRVTLPVFALMLAACDQNIVGPAAATPTQVVAKVDGDEISIHQLNDILERTRTQAEDEAAAKLLRRQVLEKLVDQQLLVQKALLDKIDRTPDVQMALDAARREVLATAYLKQVSAQRTKPDEAAIRKYYDEHPALFSRRRVFVLQEINFVNSKVPAESQAAIKAIVEAGKPIDETVKALRGRGIEFTQNEGQRASEQITTELLPALYTRQPGQGLYVPTSPASSLLYVKAFEDAPLSESDSLPRVAKFLENQALAQDVAVVMGKLRAKAKIDYFGDFSVTDGPLVK